MKKIPAARLMDSPVLSRRGVLMLFGAFGATGLAACVGNANGADGGNDVLSGGETGADGSTATDSTAVMDSGTVTDAGGAWATGGTRMITGTYPDAFATPGTTCALTCQATIGPCHTVSPERTDVSDALDGLPMMLSIRLLDESCVPLQNAIVEIWQTNYSGVYSGNINSMCNTSAADRAAMFFRGYQRTDATGKVSFKSCFPGWYSGRAVHIHVRVQTGTYAAADNATAAVISQLFFTDDLVRSVMANEPLYSAHGVPDTLLGTDNVIGGTSDKTPYICDVTRAADGVMLASKTFIVRNAGSTCTLTGSGMMGGPADGGRTPPDGG